MRKSIIVFAVGMLAGVAAHALPYTLTRTRAVTTAQIDAFFQIAVDRGAWPGTAGTVNSLCGYRTPGAGRITVSGSRVGTDVQMGTDRPNSGDLVTVE